MNYLINDVELLGRLCSVKIFDIVPAYVQLFVTDVRLDEFSPKVAVQLKNKPFISVASLDSGFGNFLMAKRIQYPSLSKGEISSLYYSGCDSTAQLVVSSEEEHICYCASKEGIRCLCFDDFMKKTIVDERKFKMYKLIKEAA